MESDTSTLEEKEALLTDACVRHLSQANHQVAGLQDELCAKTEVMVKQQDDIKNLMAKVIALETQLKKVGGATVLLLFYKLRARYTKPCHARSTSVLRLPPPICFKFDKFVHIYCAVESVLRNPPPSAQQKWSLITGRTNIN